MRRVLQGSSELFDQGSDAAEEDVPTQPEGLHALAFLHQDGAVGYGSGLVAVALARRESRFDRVHPAKAHGEERKGGHHPGAYALDQAEEDDDDEDHQDDAELRPG